MMPGFIQVDCHTFYTDIWPRINKNVEAMESNWAEAKKGVRPIVIKWGHKDKITGEIVISAISRSNDAGDEHWVVESFFTKG